MCNVKTAQDPPNCVQFVSVDGDPIGIQAAQQGTLGATAMYAPTWAGYQFAMDAYRLAKGAAMPNTLTLQSYLVTPKNADCVAKMQHDMTDNIESFPFDKTLAQLATQYGCPSAT